MNSDDNSNRLLAQNPSLRPSVPALINETYAEASDMAANDLANDRLPPMASTH